MGLLGHLEEKINDFLLQRVKESRGTMLCLSLEGCSDWNLIPSFFQFR